MTLFAQPLSLPTTVPADGVALLLLDGRLADDPLRGPGPLNADPAQAAALLFPKRRLRLTLEVNDLRSKEGVRLELSVSLDLRLTDPVRCWQDLVGELRPVPLQELATLLATLLRTALRPVVYGLTLAELYADPHLRAWLTQAVRAGLADVDLEGRSGLVVEGVDAYDLRLRYVDARPGHAGQEPQAATYYLPAGLGQPGADKHLFDEAWLAELQANAAFAPTPAELAPSDPGTQRAPAADPLHEPAIAPTTAPPKPSRGPSFLRGIPSRLRPELWRQSLGEPVHATPLVAEGRVWVASARGNLFALDAQSGAPLLSEPLALGVAVGDGMAYAGGRIWIPGHDGTLFAVDPTQGRIVQRIAVGGKLSSAPLAETGTQRARLLVAVNTDQQRWEDAHVGSVVVVDVETGRFQSWPADRSGLRSQPTRVGDQIAVADARGRLHLVSGAGGRALASTRGGRISGGVCTDAEQARLFVGDGYGFVRSLRADGTLLWETRLGAGANNGAVVGRPLLHDGALWVGCADGRLYSLDPAHGEPLHPPLVTGGPIVTTPVGYRGLVLVGSHDGHFYAVTAANGTLYWSYRSGYPLLAPPAQGEQGRLFLADSAGHVSALHWCLTHYADAAREAQAADEWGEAFEFWLMAGVPEAALEVARLAQRVDWEAQLYFDMQLYEKAARAHAQLASQTRKPARQAAHWAKAAEAWALVQNQAEARACRLARAQALGAPLLDLEQANLPALTTGQMSELQVVVKNPTTATAYQVSLTYRGQVQHSDSVSLYAIGPGEERAVTIPVTPTTSGSALVRLVLRYCDREQTPQSPVEWEARLSVAQVPVMQTIYHGPVIDGNGTIIQRGVTQDAIPVAPDATLPPGSAGTVYHGPVIRGDGVVIQRSGHRDELPPANPQPATDAPGSDVGLSLVVCPACATEVPATRYCQACNAQLA